VSDNSAGGIGARLKGIILGKAKDIGDPGVFHKLSLIAFFAWVGLGADGLSSANYGPEGSFLSLGASSHLGLFVALAMAITVIVISSSYSQIAELFPRGGGGYTVASTLSVPHAGDDLGMRPSHRLRADNHHFDRKRGGCGFQLFPPPMVSGTSFR